MTSSIIYNRVTINIASGEKAFADNVQLEAGTCLGVHFVSFMSSDPEFAVEIGVNNSQGGILLNPTDYRDYIHRDGGYFNGMKQVNFPTKNNRFFINITAEKPLTKEFKGQLIFTIQRDCQD